MEETVKINVYKKCLITRDNVILDANRDFLDLIGYRQNELLGKTLAEVGKILRIDSQVNLQDIEGDTTIVIFTKELLAIEGTISCEKIDNGTQKVFLFKIDPFNTANQNFNLANQLAKSRGDGVAIFGFPSLALINSNQSHFNFLEAPYNKRANSIGKNIMEILPEDLYVFFDKIKTDVISTGNTYYGEEIRLNPSLLGETYWDVSLVPILENEKMKYLILYLSNETEKVLNRATLTQRNEDLETIIENISDEIIIFDKDLNVNLSSENIEDNLIFNNPSSKTFNNVHDFKDNTSIYDEENQLIPYENWPFQRVSRGEFISNFPIKTINDLGIVYRETSGYPKYDKNGNFSSGILIFKDIKDRIAREEARLIKAQNELLTK